MISQHPILVTVGIVTYNRPDMLKAAIQSVLNQSYSNFELLISNDYIPAGLTFDILDLEPDARIIIVNQEFNLGEINNLNFLLKLAHGEWFVWLADDDLFHPEFLSSVVQSISNSYNINVVGYFTNYTQAVSPDEFCTNILRLSDLSKFFHFNPSIFLAEYISRRIALIGCYGVVKTSALRLIGGITLLGNSFGPYSDTLIPVLLLEHGHIAWLNESLVFFRTHSYSQSNSSYDFEAFTTAESDFLIHLRRVATLYSNDVFVNRLLFDMIKWFACDELTVLNRNFNLTKWQVGVEFISYQIKVNFPRLTVRFRFYFLFYLFYVLARFSLARSMRILAAFRA